MTAWVAAVAKKAQVHLVLGMYILRFFLAMGGSSVGKPSRW
jgi:hypothetical protein